jgi:hypothetical protein
MYHHVVGAIVSKFWKVNGHLKLPLYTDTHHPSTITISDEKLDRLAFPNTTLHRHLTNTLQLKSASHSTVDPHAITIVEFTPKAIKGAIAHIVAKGLSILFTRAVLLFPHTVSR